MTEEKIDEIRASNARIRADKEKLAARLKALQELPELPAFVNDILASDGKPTPRQTPAETAEEARRESQRSMWDALDVGLGD